MFVLVPTPLWFYYFNMYLPLWFYCCCCYSTCAAQIISVLNLSLVWYHCCHPKFLAIQYSYSWCDSISVQCPIIGQRYMHLGKYWHVDCMSTLVSSHHSCLHVHTGTCTPHTTHLHTATQLTSHHFHTLVHVPSQYSYPCRTVYHSHLLFSVAGEVRSSGEISI